MPPIPEQLILSNGLRVLLLEDHSFPVVSSLMWYRVGARNEMTRATGLSHLVEHLLFRNIGTFRNGEAGATIARNGGQFNGYTSDDFTTFFSTMAPSKLDLALRIESDRMRGANFSQTDVREEISAIQAEFDRESKDPVESLSREVRAAAYQQHPYHNPTMGWRGDLENLTATQARTFYDQYYRPDNATLIIVGDFQVPEATLLIKKYFGGLPKAQSPLPVVAATEPVQKGERRVIVKHLGKQEVMQVAYHAPALNEGDAAAMTVIEKLLNASQSGKLKAKLIDSRTCTSASCALETKQDPGLVTITCYAAPGSTPNKIIDSVEGILNQLKSQPLPDAELRRARNQAKFAYFGELDSPYRLGFQLGYFDSLVGWRNANTWTDRLQSVAAADVQRAAKKYFNHDNRVVGWLSTPNAPKPPPAPAEPPAPKESQPKAPHPVRMTGYKTDDSAPGPYVIAAAPDSTPGMPAPAGAAQASSSSTVPAAKPGSAGSLPASKVTPAPAGTTQASGTTAAPASLPASTLGNPVPAITAQSSSATTAPAVKTSSPETQPTSSIPRAVERSTPAFKSVQQRHLRNGVRLIVLESHLAPIIQIAGAIKAGDALDLPGKRGLSAMATAILNSGSSKHTHAQMSLMQEDLGLTPNAMLRFEAGPEFITFKSRCLSQDVSNQMSLLAETLTSPALPEDEGSKGAGAQTRDSNAFDKLKQEVLSSVKRGEDSLPVKVERILLQNLVATVSPYYPADVSEKAKGISSLRPADVKAFLTQQITPDATTIVVVGDINADHAVQVLEKQFSSWTTKGTAKKLSLQLSSKRILRAYVPTRDKTKTTLSLGQIYPITPGSSEYAALLLTNCALTDHPLSSRMAQRLAAESLLAKIGEEGISSTLRPFSNATEWSLTLAADAGVVPPAVRTLTEEMKKLSKVGFTAEEVNEAKRYLLGAIPVKFMGGISASANSLLGLTSQGCEASALSAILDSLKTTTAESVGKFIKNTFRPEQASLVVAGDSKSIQAIRKQPPTAAKASAGSSGRN